MLEFWKSFDSEPQIDKITDKLYISDFKAATERKLLDELKITHILVAGKFLEVAFRFDFKYLQLPLLDRPDQDLIPHFQEAFDFIDGGERVLVHCAAGISRSSSIAIAYLMMKNKWRYIDAYNLVKKSRPIIDPNEGFVTQLKKLEKSLEEEGHELSKFIAAEIAGNAKKEETIA